MESVFLKLIVESLLLVDVRKTNTGHYVMTAANPNAKTVTPHQSVVQLVNMVTAAVDLGTNVFVIMDFYVPQVLNLISSN